MENPFYNHYIKKYLLAIACLSVLAIPMVTYAPTAYASGGEAARKV
jgi:hypothetical protein